VRRKPKLSRLAKEALREFYKTRAESRKPASLIKQAKALLEGKSPPIEPDDSDEEFSSWTEAGGPGETSSSLFSWIEEQSAINRTIAASLRQNRGANKKADDLQIWLEFKRRRPTSHKSDTALTAEIGRKRGLSRSAAIDARKRGQKLAGS
jgi:hypothetical protein